MSITREKNEDKLLKILKRNGYRDVVDVCLQVILTLISLVLFFTPVALLLLFLIFPNVNFMLGLLFFWLVALEMFLIDTILKYTLGGTMGFALKLAFYGLQLFVLIV